MTSCGVDSTSEIQFLDVILRRAERAPRDRTKSQQRRERRKDHHTAGSVSLPVSARTARTRRTVPHAGFAALQDDILWSGFHFRDSVSRCHPEARGTRAEGPYEKSAAPRTSKRSPHCKQGEPSRQRQNSTNPSYGPSRRLRRPSG